VNISTNPEIQIKKGREAVIYFHNDSVVYPNYGLTLEGLIAQVSNNHPEIFLEGFGFAIENLNMDGFFGGGRVKDAMEKFAARAQGRVPSNMSAFFNALSDEATQVNWVDATGFVTKEVASQVIEGVAEVGTTITDTLGSLKTILPIVLVGAVVFIIATRAKQLAG
jgi:hypothetical protein